MILSLGVLVGVASAAVGASCAWAAEPAPVPDSAPAAAAAAPTAAPTADLAAPQPALTATPITQAVKVKPAAKKTDAAAKPADASAAQGEEKKEDDKWWHVTFSYSTSHNISAERPQWGNAFAVEPTFTLPYKLNLMAHIGFNTQLNYHSKARSGSDSYYSSSDITYQMTDMDPLLVSLSRKWELEKVSKLSITAKIDQLVPYTSRYVGRKDQWYYAVKPSVGLSVSRWGFTLANSFAVQKNAHHYDYYYYHDEEDGGAALMPLNSVVISDMTSLRYHWKKLDAGIAAGYSVPFRYNPSMQGNRIGTVRAAADVGYDVLDSLNLSLSIENAGPERYNGGFKGDRNYPFKKAQFTQFAFTIAYTL